MKEPGRKRRHDLDALRGFAMLLGVVFRALVAPLGFLYHFLAIRYNIYQTK